MHCYLIRLSNGENDHRFFSLATFRGPTKRRDCSLEVGVDSQSRESGLRPAARLLQLSGLPACSYPNPRLQRSGPMQSGSPRSLVATRLMPSESAFRPSARTKRLTVLPYRSPVSGSRQCNGSAITMPRPELRSTAALSGARVDAFANGRRCDPRSSRGCFGSHAPYLDSLS